MSLPRSFSKINSDTFADARYAKGKTTISFICINMQNHFYAHVSLIQSPISTIKYRLKQI